MPVSKLIFKWVKRYAGLFILSILIMLIYAALFQGRAILIQPFLDEVVNKGNWQALKIIALVGIGITLLLFCFRYLKEFLPGLIRQKIIKEVRGELAQHMLKLPLTFYSNQKAGDTISRVTNDVYSAEVALRTVLQQGVVNIFNVIAGVIIAFYASSFLTVVALVSLPIFVLPLWLIGKKIRQRRKEGLESLGEVTQSLSQIIGGIRVIKAFKAEPREYDEFEKKNLRVYKKDLSVIRKKALSMSFLELYIASGICAFFIIGGIVATTKVINLTPGSIALFMLALAHIHTPMRALAEEYNRFQESLAGITRISELLSQKTEPPEPPDLLTLEPVINSITLKNVTFAYDRQEVLQDINLEIKSGESVAIVGRSGVGKTTLIDLICGFYHPTSGSICVNNIDLQKIKRSSWLDKIAIVPQDVFLFNTTIAENINYGKLSATEQDIKDAAIGADIHDFISGLDSGYQTLVGERGAKLSGGQKQRIALARALIKKPSLLILDEATSALDSESERAIQASLDKFLREEPHRIVLIISHRLSTIKNASRIIVLDEGKVVEEGTHDELMKRNSVYANLYRQQQLVEVNLQH